MDINKRTPFVKFSILDIYNDIVLGELNGSGYVDRPTAIEIVSNRIDFTQNRNHYLILELSGIKEVSHEAKEYLQAEEGLKNILGAAFVANDPISILIANVFIKVPKNFEARIFTNKSDALIWLLELKKKKTE